MMTKQMSPSDVLPQTTTMAVCLPRLTPVVWDQYLQEWAQCLVVPGVFVEAPVCSLSWTCSAPSALR